MSTAPADVVCIASWNADLCAQVPQPPRRGETLLASGFTISPGGKGSNAAIACARQGARTAVVARIGCDAFGDMAMALWQQEGLDTSHVERSATEPSGVAQILIYPDGDNSIAVAPGAGAGLGPAQIERATTALRACRVLMASCEVPLAATLAAFRVARAAGVTTVLNPAPAPQLAPAERAELLALCDVLTPNEGELRALAGLDDSSTLTACAEHLLAAGVGSVVVTLGAQGCRAWRSNQPALTVPGHLVTVADTVGAGDTFTGALAAALSREETLDSALPLANAAAAMSVRAHGAIGGMSTREETMAWLADQRVA